MRLTVEYVAGFFDGEGSIGVYENGRKTPFLRTQLTQNVGRASSLLLGALVERYGGNLSRQKTSHGVKFNWQLNSRRACRFLVEMTPHLVLKKEQAEMAVAWFFLRDGRAQRSKGGRFLPMDSPIDKSVVRLLKELKTKDIDAVMAAQTDLVEVVHTLKQVVCVKG